MFIESPRYTERFGSVRINHLQRVISLDSGLKSTLPDHGAMGVMKVNEDVIKYYEERMAIIISIKDEKLKLFEGVVSGVPHDCLIIVVSNSQREKVDRFRMEKDALEQLCRYTLRQALIVHQKDVVMTEAIVQAGFTDLLDEKGQIHDGKSEGMMLGLLIAKAVGKEYVGFIDADNYFPGAVLEYVRNYAAGFSMARSPYSMVRILWHYKPKISRGLFFQKWGRVSETTNKHMNNLISIKTGFESEIIKTGNAGEHAMSIRLAEILTYASGYAVEPQELVSIFEGFGGILPTTNRKAMEDGIDVFQIETRNPHLHEEKGDEHIKEMLKVGLSTIYYSALCNNEIKQAVIAELIAQGALQEGERLPPLRTIAPFKKANFNKFMSIMEKKLDKYSVLAKTIK